MPSPLVAIETPTGLRLAISRASIVAPGARDALERIDAPIVAGSGARSASLARTRARAPEEFSVGLGPCVLEAELTREAVAASACVSMRLRNTSARPQHVERVALAVDVPCDASHDLAYLKNGWQSWSLCGVAPIERAGDPVFPSGPWLRGMHHAVGLRSPGREDWHESHGVSVVQTGAICALAGACESGRQFALVNLRRLRRGAAAVLELEVELVVERSLAAGEVLELEEVWLALGSDAHRLLEAHATRWGHVAGALTGAPFQAGWCSWYHYFHGVTEEALLRNLEALAARRDALPISLVQLDDGYQRAIGDWLEVNEKFPRGLAFVADRIRDAGFEAGLWTAPFSAVRHSHLLERHPDWALRGDDGEWLRGTLIPQWSDEGWCYALDPSHPALRAHLESLYAELVAMGFTYQKLDFLYMAAMRGTAYEPGWTRAERLARGLDAVRAGAGEDAFLLGCGCPLGAAVGRVDGMRIGPDVAPYWSVDAAGAIPGIEPALPATDSAIRSITTRLWMHRRLWLDDPDCLMVRRRETALSEDETGSLAHAIAASGGMVVFSDDVSLLGDEEAALVCDTTRVAREVDAASAWGGARHVDLLGLETARRQAPVVLEAATGRTWLRAELNLGDAPLSTVAGPLAPHASRLETAASAPAVAVFCDFDGTFIEQDVGSGLARTHLAEKREDLHTRFDAGELDAWAYIEALFGGFDLAEPDRLAYLRGITLDPGARGLVELCRREGWPFEVLSDGFDLNIEELRRRFDLDFRFRANGLEVGAGGWRVSPHGRNPGCACGTGLCKRAVLEAFRAEHPRTLLVYVGNGRISDLCAALEADRVFAKDTLPAALDQTGRRYTRFSSLVDVSGELERTLLGALVESR